VSRSALLNTIGARRRFTRLEPKVESPGTVSRAIEVVASVGIRQAAGTATAGYAFGAP
jgi:hypothetical protein